MTSSENRNLELAEELAKGVHATTSLVQSLLGELRENGAALAVLETKLQSLNDNVKILSQIIRDGNGKGSVITRLALVEKELEDLAEKIKDHVDHDEDFENEIHKRVSSVKNSLNEFKDSLLVDKKSEKDFDKQKTLGILKLLALALPGAIALIIKLIELYGTK